MSFGSIRRETVAVLALSALGATWWAQQKPAPAPNPGAPAANAQVEWAASFPDAQRLAKESKRPLFIAFNMDHEVANDLIVSKVYRDPKFVEKSKQFVCVIASIYDHESAPNASGAPVCQRFGAISCADHKQCEIKAREALLGGTLVIAPQHVITAPDGRVVARRAYTLSLAELLKMMDGALRACGAPGATVVDPKVERAEIAALIEQAEKARRWKKDAPLREIADRDTPESHAALLDYAVKGGNEETRVAIVRLLGRSGDYSALDTLCKVVKDQKPYVALAAVDALGKLRLPDSKDDLKKLLSNYHAGSDRGRILRAWASVARDDATVPAFLVKEARSTDVVVRAHAICAMGVLPSSPELDDFLKKTLSDHLPAARAAAAWAIGVGRHKNCRDELQKVLEGDSPVDVKEIAQTAIAHFDHAVDDPNCCNIESSIWRFVPTGDPRRD